MLPKQRLYEKFVRKMLMKLTPDQRTRFGGQEGDLNPSWSPNQYGGGGGFGKGSSINDVTRSFY